MDKSTKKCLKSWTIPGWSFSEIDPDGGFLSHGGTPKWLVYFMENPNLKWMITGGNPILGNLHIIGYSMI